ncbi:MAG: caspase family protein [Pedosphaera sp.]|nr:caspase family protein [Pedosphaera sp.]
MVKGFSLHIGLNHVDPKRYGGWDGALTACHSDATDMRKLADSRGFTSRLLLSSEATSKVLASEFAAAATQLKKGDIFFLSYSGHGGQQPDTNGDEPDAKDETWVLYDREFLDDELNAKFAKFAAGVRIIVLSDSCHSGTVARSIPIYKGIAGIAGLPTSVRFRAIPEAISRKVWKQNRVESEQIQKALPLGDSIAVRASVILISGCQDNQLSLDGKRNGLFTEKLRKVWKKGKFSSSYKVLRNEIAAAMPPTQTPNYLRTGAKDDVFARQPAFTI